MFLLHTVANVFTDTCSKSTVQVATSLSAIASGTTFGVFTLGMLFP